MPRYSVWDPNDTEESGCGWYDAATPGGAAQNYAEELTTRETASEWASGIEVLVRSHDTRELWLVPVTFCFDPQAIAGAPTLQTEGANAAS